LRIQQRAAQSVSIGELVKKKKNELPLFCVTVYLHVSPSPTDVQLSFNFGPSDGETRQWNILIAMIPCSSKVLGILLPSMKIKKRMKLILIHFQHHPIAFNTLALAREVSERSTGETSIASPPAN
jgi:hypothetical protein